MSEYTEMPKGMKKLPEEYADHEPSGRKEESIDHIKFNYTAIIRNALKNLSDQGLDISVKRIEVVEQEHSAALINVVAEVRGAE